LLIVCHNFVRAVRVVRGFILWRCAALGIEAEILLRSGGVAARQAKDWSGKPDRHPKRSGGGGSAHNITRNMKEYNRRDKCI
jgi:hypothetical protein